MEKHKTTMNKSHCFVLWNVLFSILLLCLRSWPPYSQVCVSVVLLLSSIPRVKCWSVFFYLTFLLMLSHNHCCVIQGCITFPCHINLQILNFLSYVRNYPSFLAIFHCWIHCCVSTRFVFVASGPTSLGSDNNLWRSHNGTYMCIQQSSIIYVGHDCWKT